MNRHQLARPFNGRDSRTAVMKLNVSSPIATSRMTIATIGDVSSSGCWILCMPS